MVYCRAACGPAYYLRHAGRDGRTGRLGGGDFGAGRNRVEALFNYAQAVSFDPGQLEVLARLGTLSATISGGSIGERIINDFQARDRWLEVFKETARFYREHPPFEITFDPSLEQEGETDYAHRTANLVMRVALTPSEAGFAALNVLLEGLEQTGQRNKWGFDGWPLHDLKPAVPGTTLFADKNSTSFTLEVLLQNDKQKQIGKGTITLEARGKFLNGNKTISPPAERFDTIRFQNVKADELSQVLTIVISAVNRIPSKTLNSTGYMRIAPGEVSAMVKINGGTFTMGSPKNEAGRNDDEVQHQVTVSAFYMGRYEVTQREWREVMGNNHPGNWKGDNLPVEQVRWYEAVEYCNKRSQQEGLMPAYTINGENVSWNRNANGYRLPTEAEWEYACRAGTTSSYNTGNNITTSQANYSSRRIFDAGSFAANAWGLYDMHGNVWEWCWDLKGDYASGSQSDPIGHSTGAFRVIRGGSWLDNAQHVRSAYRGNGAPAGRASGMGFRLVRN